MPQLRPVLALALPLLTALASAQRPDPIPVNVGRGLQLLDADHWRGLGRDYRIDFTAEGARFEPALGAAVVDVQHIALAYPIVSRGGRTLLAPTPVAPTRCDYTIVYERAAAMRERYEITSDHVELSWVFDHRPAGEGDLVVRYRLDSSLPLSPRAADGGLAFVIDGVGGVQVGTVTGIDADGEQVAGTITAGDDWLELSLPAAFVDTAAYPMVLDPTFGSEVLINQGNSGYADVCYDSATNRFLVVWQQQYGMGVHEIRGQLLDPLGTLVQGQFVLSTSGDAERPRVANLATRSRFGVVWKQRDGATRTIRYAAVDAAVAGVTHSLTLASTTAGILTDADIGCDTHAPNGSGRGFVAVWDDQANDEIRARRLYYSSNDTLVGPATTTVWADSQFGTVYSQPAISRAAAGAGDLLVVATRFSLVGSSESIVMTVLPSDGTAAGPSSSVGGGGADIDRPAVDGYGGEWVVAWQQAATPFAQIRTLPVRLDNGALTQASSIAHGSPTEPVMFAALGYTPGRTWLSYERNISGAGYMVVQAIDSSECVTCPDSFGNNVGIVDDLRQQIATGTSAGDTDFELSMVAWGESGVVYAQILINHGPSASSTTLGGGCGGGGTQSLSHAPGIGSSGVVCTVGGMSPTAIATIFNLSTPVIPLPCGACEWTPFQVTAVLPVIAGGASLQFPIPCLSTLIGAQLETQWTTLDPAASPCPVLPGFVLSDRLLLTLDN